MEEVRGQACAVLEFTRGEVTETYWFRNDDGVLIQQRRPNASGEVQTDSFEHYIDFAENGLKVPATHKTTVAGQPLTIRIASVTFNPDFEEAHFQLTP